MDERQSNGGVLPLNIAFPCVESAGSLSVAPGEITVRRVRLNTENNEMRVELSFPCRPPAAEISILTERIKREYKLADVVFETDYPGVPEEMKVPVPKAKEPAPAEKKKKPVRKSEGKGGKSGSGGSGKSDSARRGKQLYGSPSKGELIPMSELSQESGKVMVRGEVFAVNNREVRNGAQVLNFDMTDYTGSIRVSKYLRKGSDAAITEKLQKGMYITVQGNVAYNRYDEDIVLEPDSIEEAVKQARTDTAEEKRVELHLHTRMSALDALTDPAAVIETAERWGHRAVAITDHGVAQAFPEVWKAQMGKNVKVIYGLEGYYQNDVDDRLAICGASEHPHPLRGEYVAFDLETTGLDSVKDRITEIGAVIFRDGEITATFETFVNPGIRIPREITELTGIGDRDVFDAPVESEAVRGFLDFIGDRPLVAHNAEFDVGFIRSACARMGEEFEPCFIDTLVIAQTLLPNLRRHRLNIVAAELGLPDFRHHRAEDDAITVGRIFERFIPMLESEGAVNLVDAEAIIAKKRGSSSSYRTWHIILLVRNKQGLKNLYELISQSHLEYFHKNPIIPKSLLLQYREGLIIGSACASGEIFSAVLGNRSESELRRLASFYDYLEIQPIVNNSFLLRDNKVNSEEDLRELNRRIVGLAKSLNLPVAATGDAHFLEPEHEIYRRILLAAKKFNDSDNDLPIYFKTTDEMLEEFGYLGEDTAHEVVVKTPNAIADMCEEIELFPKELFTPTIENSAEDLQRIVWARCRELYGDTPPEIITKRVEDELRDIIDCRYDVIYMSAQKLVQNSLEAGYLVGSRGSVGSSLVAYMSGITEVNSLPAHYRCPDCQHTDFESGREYGCGADMPDAACPDCGALYEKDGFDIPFETFLGIGGDKIPDIDLNFSGEYQSRAHKYTEELFGKKNVYRAGTIGTLAEKTAYGYVKNYLTERDLTVTKAEENRLAQGLVGVRRTTGQHPGGLVIIPDNMDVTEFCPVQHPADSADKGVVTTHFDYHSMEDNLLKLDELGHDDPTMIKMLEDLTGTDARKIPLGDPGTMQIFTTPAALGLPEDDSVIGKTGTIGIPEFGTGFTRGMLADTTPNQFDMLVRLSGFSHGTDVWLSNAKDLILNGTASITETIACRDDIMLDLIAKGMEPKLAFKVMETVRKGRGLTPEWIETMRELNVPAWYIESCQKIKYLFPKAHAVAYVMMAFRIAWFKVNEPLAYYSAYFHRRSDSFDAEIMTRGIERVRKKLLELGRLDKATAKEQDLMTTLESVYEFYMRGFDFEGIDLYESDATKFTIVGNDRLRPPFTAISGLGETAAADIVVSRQGKRFVSIEELQSVSSKLSGTHVEQLKALGALGDMPDTSQISFF